MAHLLREKQNSLARQILLPLLVLVILTALAVGIPAILVFQDQIEHQAQILSEQGSQTTQILITNQLNDLSYLAVLTAQRPTLHRLILENDLDQLPSYLDTLRQGAGLGAILLCQDSTQPILQVGMGLPDQICQGSKPSQEIIFDSSNQQGWLLAIQPIPFEMEGMDVVVGISLNNQYAAQLANETGLEQILLFDGNFLASSYAVQEGILDTFQPGQLTLPSRLSPYYSLHRRYQDTGLETIVSLPASRFIQARQELSRFLGGSILIVILLSSGLGILSAQRISRPLEKLRDSAQNLRYGDLTTPIQVETSVRELALLSYVLDDARVTLSHSISELRNEKAWTDQILESVVEGIIILDRNKNITYFSPGAEQISGWEGDEVLSRPVDEVLPLFTEKGSFSQCLPDPGGKQRIAVKVRNGRPATLAITRASIRPPESPRSDTVLVLRDVSSEETIHRLLGDFLANITHEFRTPLSALAASAELLLDQLPDLEHDELVNLLNNIHLGIFNLQTLIDNLLEGASIETGRFRVSRQASDIHVLIQETCASLLPLTAKYGMEIEIEIAQGLPLVLADPRRTSQVLVNLISNAIRWAASGKTIQVSAVQSPAGVEVSVSDHGPGIPLEHQASLFHPFPNSHVKTHPQQGAGLGLSVVKAIIEAQGGSVGMRDRPGGGSIFWFTVLLAPLGSPDEGTP